MSTRSAIIITDGKETLNIYKHNDGYPQGVGNVRLIKEILSEHIDIPSIKESFKQENPAYPSQGRARIESSFNEPLKASHFGEQSDLEFVYLLDLKNKQLNIYGNNIREHTQDAPMGTPVEHIACGPIDVDKFKTDTLKETLSQYREQALDDILELKNDIQLLERVGLKVNKPHEIEQSPEVLDAKKSLGIATPEQDKPVQALPGQDTPGQQGAKTVRQQIVDRIVDGLENNKLPWQKPWVGNSRPYNPVTGTVYKGANNMLLSMTDYNDPRFMTFKQANAQGYSIKKGEKGIPIIKVIEYGKEVENKETGETEIEKRPALKMYTVFNASQINGIPPLEIKDKPFNNIDVAEKILENSGAVIKHGGSQAYYNPTSDEIRLPEKSSFHTEQAYYSTALHELAHWSGAESRLNRDLTGKFGTPSYAKEELRAEFASAIVGAELGLPLTQEHIANHSAYIKSWVSVLKDNPSELFKAVNDAEKITDYVLAFDKELTLDKQMLDKKVQNQELPVPEKEYAGIVSANSKDFYVVKTAEKENIVVQAIDSDKNNKAVEVKDNDIVSNKGNELKNVAVLENVQNFESQIKDKKLEQAQEGKMYGGKIVDVKDDTVLQQVGKDRIIVHNKDRLSKELKAGDKVQIFYGANKTIVTDRNRQMER